MSETKASQFREGKYQLFMVPKTPGDGENILIAESGQIASVSQLDEWCNIALKSVTVPGTHALQYVSPGDALWQGELPKSDLAPAGTGTVNDSLLPGDDSDQYASLIKGVSSPSPPEVEQMHYQRKINRQIYDKTFAQKDEFRKYVNKFGK